MAATAFDVDRVHTFIGFSVPYLAISRVQGRFTRFEGLLEIDWDDLTRSTAHLRIETDSIETGHPERDAHLRSADFLDVARFPEMKFASGEVRRKSGSVFEVSGHLLLHGVSRPVALEADYGGRATDAEGRERVGLLARGAVDRRLFGLAWNRPVAGGGIMVGHDVALDLSIQGIRGR